MIATWLLHQSVPAAARTQVNPLGSDPADIVAGRDLFRHKCESCHGYDGSGKTDIGAGEYPRPPALQANITAMPDGEIFYHIRNGIRNTGMPAWSMPDIQIWQRLWRTFVTCPWSRRYRQSAWLPAPKVFHGRKSINWAKSALPVFIGDFREDPDSMLRLQIVDTSFALKLA